ncbi:uncharacterized protein [Hyperolius riggenbachi]|uniref:uncharacterized protein n=1 Tax=Hyperolius riggenbachi TaxID=752182 RepID=UPI0035A286E8
MGIYHLCLLSVAFYALLQVAQSQIFMIKNAQLEKCIHAADDTGRVSLAKCKVNSHHQYWSWEPSTKSIINTKSRQCLTVLKPRDQPTLKVEPCEGSKNQAWLCDSRGYLSLYSHELHLTAKQGTKKVILSKGMDKFSKWKTLQDSPVCGESGDIVMPTTIDSVQSSPPTYTTEDRTETFPGAEFGNTTAVSLGTSPPVTEPTATSQHPGESYTAEIEDGQPVSSWERIYVFEEDGMGWKTAMLILSPFTFLLGVAILVLNVRMNRKRKLSALSSPSKPHHKLGTSYEQSPLTGKVDLTDHPGPDPNSPTLRHGEILIEWKDGTITPLYDQQ